MRLSSGFSKAVFMPVVYLMYLRLSWKENPSLEFDMQQNYISSIKGKNNIQHVRTHTILVH